MPSDPRVLQALDLLAEPIGRFQAAVVATLEELRGTLAVTRSGAQGRVERLKAQFGAFAEGRVDVGRLAAVLDGDRGLGPDAEERLDAAYDALRAVATHGRDMFVVDVPPGTPVATAVSAQLAAIGRVFGATRVAAAARGQKAVLNISDERALGRFPFAEWNPAERRLAPPLIVTVSGRDLNVASLAPLLDGAVKILLIVEGPCAPAPLVRLITPNVYVQQAHAIVDFAGLARYPGAGLGALMSPAGGCFIHDPAAGAELWRRLTVSPGRPSHLSRLGGLTALQQTEEVLQLEALAARPASTAVEEPRVGALREDPAGRLATWLLHQAQLTGVGEPGRD